MFCRIEVRSIRQNRIDGYTIHLDANMKYVKEERTGITLPERK